MQSLHDPSGGARTFGIALMLLDQDELLAEADRCIARSRLVADYVAATEELKLLERAARAKHCSSPENWSSSSAIH
jgi:hypothetical protein